ncbi:glycoside hydrolase [Aureobasidium sp. EXF-10727]|nr:glycoside hydrolase [Aureobasidium sp. EXF-10727]
MSFKIAAAAALATLASTVSAHGYLQSIDASGTTYTGFNNSVLYMSTKPDLIAWSDTVTDDGYVSDYASPDMICHAGAANAKLSAPVNGGDTVSFNWNTWPSDHRGPVITYLAKCDGDCADADKTSLKWFKIDAVGLISGDSVSGTWASNKLIADGFKWDVKIPDSIASGNYVARHEIIALHSANNIGGAQNYPQCINLEIKSSGSDEPEGVVGTSLYTAQDKGIYVSSFYYPGIQAGEYDMPGPALYTAGSGSATVSSAAASSASSWSSAEATSTWAASSTESTWATSYAEATSTRAPSSAEATWAASSSSAAPITTQAAVVASSAAAGSDGVAVVTQYETDVVTQSTAVTVTEGAAPTAAVKMPVSEIASAVPSSVLTSTISAGVPTGTASAGVAKPTKALPEGTTLEDLLSWVEYLFAENNSKAATKHRRHARAFRH